MSENHESSIVIYAFEHNGALMKVNDVDYTSKTSKQSASIIHDSAEDIINNINHKQYKS